MPVKVVNDEMILDPKKMVIDESYYLTYQDEEYVFQKTEEGHIDIFIVVSKQREDENE